MHNNQWIIVAVFITVACDAIAVAFLYVSDKIYFDM